VGQCTLALVAVAGVMLGLAVSASAPNDDTANSLLPIIIIPQVIFAGAIIPMKDWFTQIVATVFPIRWAMAALGSSLGMNSAFIDHGTLFGHEPLYHGTLSSTTFPALFSQATAIRYMTICWAALGATILIFAVLICVLLKLKDNRA
jgi:ABC transport system ATP-binding/permease protein